MSDFINHYRCGQEALATVDSNTRNIIVKNRVLFNLGCQGPDFFLYHGIVPWKKDHGFAQYAQWIHQGPSNKLFHSMAHFYYTLKDPSHKNKAIAYILGYLCHHTLDAITHPFVFYFSGLDAHLHKEYEMALDVLNAQHQGYPPAYQFNFNELYSLDPLDITIIQNIHHHILSSIWEMMMPESAVPTCLKDMAFMTRLFPDPTGLKRRVAKSIESIINRPHIFSKAFLNKSYPDLDDYMNLTRQIWCHPCNAHLTYNFSYPDLYHQSVQSAAKKLVDFSTIIQNTDYQDEGLERQIAGIIKNSSFETGEVFSYENLVNTIPMKHFQPKRFF